MIRKCLHCGSSIFENATQCAYCFKELDENSIRFSIDGISHVYVKRENEKVFGPFPVEKVLSLVRTQKLKETEWISDDRNVWVEVSKIIEFLPSKDSSVLPHSSPPGAGLPGLKPDLPGLKTDLPAIKPDLPGIRPDLPGLKTDLPAIKPDLPGVRPDLPGVRSDLPGVRPDLPGVRPDLPGVRPDLPGVRPDLPDIRPDLPEEKQKEEEESSRESRDFSLPPIGGGALPELRIDMKSSPLELKLDEFIGKAENTLNPQNQPAGNDIRSSLFSTSEGIDFSGLSAGSSREKADMQPLSLQPMTEEKTLPLMDDSDEVIPATAEKAKKERTKSESDRERRASLLLPLLLLLVAGAAAAGFFLFQKKDARKETAGPSISQKTVTKQEISDHERKILNLDYPGLLSSASGKELIHCESALALVWLFHDFSRVEACSPFAAQNLESGGAPALRRYQFLRAMVLASHSKASWIDKVFSSKNPVDAGRIAEEILSRAKSENQNSPFWRFVCGVRQLELGKKEKALEEFSFIRNTETTVPPSVLFFAAKAGDESAAKSLQENREAAFWKDLFEGERFMSAHEKDFSFLFLPEGFPAIGKAENGVDHGPRFTSLHRMHAGISAWQKGLLDEAMTLCEEALKLDPESAKPCRSLQVFHGQFGWIATQVPAQPDVAHIVSLLAEGRIQTALSNWDEWKKANPEKTWVAPLVLLLSRSDREEWKKALDAALSANIEKTLDLLWVGIWISEQKNWMREDLASWKEEKKPQGVSIDAFLDLLDAVLAFNQGDAENLKKRSESVKGSPAVARILEGLQMQMAIQADRKNEKAARWAEEAASSLVADARIAAAVIRIYTLLGKLQDAHVILDKVQEKLMDPQLYRAAAQLYLEGTRMDRLMRARFFVEKALKINPQDFESLMVTGFVQLESGQFDAGEKSLVQAVSFMAQPDPRWFMRWSELESRLKRSQMALAAMDMGLRKIPDYTPFLFRKAQILATQDKPKEALELLEKTKNAQGIEEVQKHILTGRCHLSLRQKKEAEDAFAKAVGADGDNILARYMLGKTALSNGNIRMALPHLEEAVKRLEKLQSEQRIPEEAAHWQAETVESMLTESYRLLGGAYKETGNRAQAIKYFKKYATLVPDGPMKDEAMRMLLLLGGE